MFYGFIFNYVHVWVCGTQKGLILWNWETGGCDLLNVDGGN